MSSSPITVCMRAVTHITGQQQQADQYQQRSQDRWPQRAAQAPPPMPQRSGARRRCALRRHDDRPAGRAGAIPVRARSAGQWQAPTPDRSGPPRQDRSSRFPLASGCSGPRCVEGRPVAPATTGGSQSLKFFEVQPFAPHRPLAARSPLCSTSTVSVASRAASNMRSWCTAPPTATWWRMPCCAPQDPQPPRGERPAGRRGSTHDLRRAG